MDAARVPLESADLPELVDLARNGRSEVITDAGAEVAAVIPMADYREYRRLVDAEDHRAVTAGIAEFDAARAQGRLPAGAMALHGVDGVAAYFAALP